MIAAEIVIVTILVCLTVIVVVFFFVTHQVVQGKTIMTGDEIDAGRCRTPCWLKKIGNVKENSIKEIEEIKLKNVEDY